MNKLIKDGKTAVLVSPGFGAGWSTWGHGAYPAEDMCMSAELAQAVLDDEGVKEVAERLFPEAYMGGLKDLEVQWLPRGTRFYIHEYDGSESLRTEDDLVMTA